MSEDRLTAVSEMSPEERARVFKVLKERALAGAESVQPRSAGFGPIPLAPMQRRLWLTEQLFPGTPAYTELSALSVDAALDAAVLERAFTEIVRRHEVLRTTFETVGEEAVQVVTPPSPFQIPVEDLRAQGDEAVQRRLAEESVHVFDLARGPLLKVTLLRTGDDASVLLVAAHHIVLDGWSIAILRRELAEFYAAYAQGRAPALPELPIQYADFALWRRDRTEGDAGLAYWKEQLAELPPLLQLPVARPRPEVATFRGARRYFVFGSELGRRVRALSQRENVTVFTTLLAAFQLLLHRYTGLTDLAVATPVANRGQAELEDLVGFFVNTLVLRGDLTGDPTTRELLARMGRTAVAALEHQDTPFDSVVEALQPERSTSYNPLSQVMFDFQNTPRPAAGRGEFAVSVLEVTSAPARFDLLVSLEDSPDGLRGYWQYSTDLFTPETIERMTGHLRVLLEGMTTDPDLPVAALPLLTPAERQDLKAWNRTEAPVLRARCIHELVTEQAARTPDAPAVSDGQRTLTYAELERRTAHLAGALRARGVGSETRVGICAERSAELVVALLGVLRAGGAYVPVDPSHPAERIAYVLADSGVPVLLTQERLLERLPAHGAEVVCLDRDWAEIEVGGGAPSLADDPDTLAYVIYTSGSTGRPKGVMNAHRGVANRLLWMQQQYPLDASDAVLQKTPFSFDVSVWEFFWPLLSGARLVLARPDGHRDPAYLAELIERERVTTLHFVPPMLQAFLESADAARCASLRRVMCSGEALPYELTERFFERFPGVELHNLYGPTEAAVEVTFHACGSEPSRVVPIGRPVANTQVHVLDPAGQPTPVGVPGELYIGGVQVGRGYAGRAELTAEKFVPDPFGDAGGRLYRTGDRARWLASGEVEYLGRSDFQVKVRGFRIELGEIEAVLLEHPSVRQAVVVARDDAPGEKRLVAYVVAGEDGATAAALRAHLEERLPEYMVPAELVHLDTLPLNPSGKVDRRALPAPRAVEAAGTGEEGSSLERHLEEVFRTTLKRDAIGRDENFFKSGGDSLLAIRAYNRLRSVTDREMAITDFFKYPTIRALAAFIESLPAPQAADDWTELERRLEEVFRTTLKRDAIGRDENFFKSGGDSLLAIRAYNRLRSVTDRELAITDFFKHPTIRALAAFIESRPPTPGEAQDP